jgi:predicted HTH transcriptional regulator
MDSVPDLLSRPEGKTLEFKRDLSSPDGLIRTIVAFANGAGGTVLVGVEDRTRAVLGLPEPQKEVERLVNLVSDRIEPRLAPDVEVLPWRDTHVVVVHVFPSPSRPHCVKRLGPEAGTFVRIGASTRRADPAQIEELRRFSRGGTFDEETRPEFDTEAVDFQGASECFAPVRVLRRADLRTLGLTVLHQGREVPTNGGILLFGVKRADVFPESVLRAGCFSGTDRSEILDSAEVSVVLPLAVEEVLRFVARNTRRALRVNGARHEEVPEYPILAVREAITNAIVHADYAQRGSPLRVAIFTDRIEVDNPGGLLPGLAIPDIRRGVSKLRNRVIGRVFHELRLIEQWGSGIPRMVRACREAGLPEPVFEELGAGFRVTLFRVPTGGPELDALDQSVLEFVRQSGGASTKEIAAKSDRTARTMRTRLRRLVDLGLLVVVGKGPRDPHRVYHVGRR